MLMGMLEFGVPATNIILPIKIIIIANIIKHELGSMKYSSKYKMLLDFFLRSGI